MKNRQRAKPPTYNLTSKAHLHFISVSKSKEKSGKPKPVTKKSTAVKRGNVQSERMHKAKKAKQVNVGEQESEVFCLVCTEPFSNSKPTV